MYQRRIFAPNGDAKQVRPPRFHDNHAPQPADEPAFDDLIERVTAGVILHRLSRRQPEIGVAGQAQRIDHRAEMVRASHSLSERTRPLPARKVAVTEEELLERARQGLPRLYQDRCSRLVHGPGQSTANCGAHEDDRERPHQEPSAAHQDAPVLG
ncbi:hypothetical protein AMJ39_07040 [candidate division TA06 bacterium DG_24]|uniref:Uncharacterized protein n=1 Tax=candidate division TA06 bacterium DG_24 TaxID=1703770 RepID=A0A0S7WRG0_UNCT6|nr:MAG: hypothetical protein AMJ39_07040 [candidate division TA06 bacterium DG_24]